MNDCSETGSPHQSRSINNQCNMNNQRNLSVMSNQANMSHLPKSSNMSKLLESSDQCNSSNNQYDSNDKKEDNCSTHQADQINQSIRVDDKENDLHNSYSLSINNQPKSNKQTVEIDEEMEKRTVICDRCYLSKRPESLSIFTGRLKIDASYLCDNLSCYIVVFPYIVL